MFCNETMRLSRPKGATNREAPRPAGKPYDPRRPSAGGGRPVLERLAKQAPCAESARSGPYAVDDRRCLLHVVPSDQPGAALIGQVRPQPIGRHRHAVAEADMA